MCILKRFHRFRAVRFSVSGWWTLTFSQNMKNFLILISFFVSGCSFGLGEVTTKGQDKIPPNLFRKGPIEVGKIREYLVHTREVTLHFYIDGTHEGKRISFLVGFSRSAELKSHAYLRVKDGKTQTDYRLDLGSKFVKALAQRVSLKLPENSDTDPPDSADAARLKADTFLLKKLGPSRVRALRTLLNGNYSRENPLE